MVKFYINQINRGLMTLEEVPKLWKTMVEKELAKKSKTESKTENTEMQA